MVEVVKKEIRHYQTIDGKVPYQEWFNSLKNQKAKAIIEKRLDRVEEGNLGEWNSVGHGVYEMKIHYGSGYRIYFGQDGPILIILLCGGDKRTQAKDIRLAIDCWQDYNRR